MDYTFKFTSACPVIRNIVDINPHSIKEAKHIATADLKISFMSFVTGTQSIFWDIRTLLGFFERGFLRVHSRKVEPLV